MTMSSFTNKLLRASITLPQGNFPGTSGNTLTLEGFRMSATLKSSGNWTNFLSLDIFGMKQADMSAVSVIWAGPQANSFSINTRAIIVLESNDGSGWLQIFEGQFQEAQANYNSMPDVCLHVEAATGYAAQWTRASPSSFPGSVSVAGLAQQLASQMGFGFENNGVTGQLNSPYFAGTLMDQFRELARDANFDYYFDAKSTLIICPPGQGRLGKTAIAINKSSGLVGYPTIQRFGVQVKCLFSPAIELGSPITLSGTEVPGADGTWYPYSAVHELESLKPGGQWFSLLDCKTTPDVLPQGISE